MSKGDSHLFQGTKGEAKILIQEVQSAGNKISGEDVLIITRTPSGNIVWLEKGNGRAGFEHILNVHQKDFEKIGVSKENIPNYILEAVYQGNIVGYQGKREPKRAIYEFKYNGEKHRLAVQVGSNGFIVSANPRSRKEK